MSETHATIDQIFREENGRVIVALARRYRDLDAAEEAVQDAYLEALRIWPRKGTPSNPAAWITTLAQRQAIDRMRRDITYEDRLESIAGEQAMKPDIDDNPELGVPDERLELIFRVATPPWPEKPWLH